MWVKCAQACTAGSAFVLFEDSRLGEQGATLASQQLLHDQDQGGGLVVDGITYHCCHPKSDTPAYLVEDLGDSAESTTSVSSGGEGISSGGEGNSSSGEEISRGYPPDNELIERSRERGHRKANKNEPGPAALSSLVTRTAGDQPAATGKTIPLEDDRTGVPGDQVATGDGSSLKQSLRKQIYQISQPSPSSASELLSKVAGLECTKLYPAGNVSKPSLTSRTPYQHRDRPRKLLMTSDQDHSRSFHSRYQNRSPRHQNPNRPLRAPRDHLGHHAAAYAAYNPASSTAASTALTTTTTTASAAVRKIHSNSQCPSWPVSTAQHEQQHVHDKQQQLAYLHQRQQNQQQHHQQQQQQHQQQAYHYQQQQQHHRDLQQ